MKKKSNVGWYMAFITCLILIGMAAGFSYGVNHQAAKEWELERHHTPLYTTKVTIACGYNQIVLYTPADCDSTRANQSEQDIRAFLTVPITTIKVEPMTWPYNDECL